MATLYQNDEQFLIKPIPFDTQPVNFHLAWHQKYENDLGHQWLRESIIKLIAMN